MKKNRYKKDNDCFFKTVISASIVGLVLIVCVLCFFVAAGNTAEIPDYDYPVSGWTSEELEEATLECVSERLSTIHTEYGTLMLEKLCYYNIIASGKKGK